MRILMLVLGTRGDLEQILCLARGLASNGNEIVIATSPFFRERVTDEGLGFLAIGGAGHREFTALLSELAAVDDLRAQVQIYLTRWLRPQLRQGMSNLRLGLAWCEYSVNNLRMVWQRSGRVLPGAVVTYDPPQSPQRLAHYASRRIRHDGRILELVAMNRDLVDPHREWGSDFKFTGFWFDPRARDYRPDPDLARFLRQGAAPVVLTMGSMMMFDAPRLENVYREALETCGLRGILIGGWTPLADTGLGADGLYRAPEIPYDWLLARTECVIHHGGSGSVGAALRSGCPSILLPCIISQHHFAEILKREHLAVTDFQVKDLQAPALANALRGVAQIRDAARAWSLRARADGGVVEAVSLVEEHWRTVQRGE